MDPVKVSTISTNVNSLPILNGTNFKDWKENIEIVLGCMDLDLALRCDQPTSLTDASSCTAIQNFEKWECSNRMDLDFALRCEQPTSLTDASSSAAIQNFEKWERSNRMCLMIIKHDIPKTFRGAVSDDITTVKEFLTKIEKRFAKNDKAETSMLLQSLISMKYNGNGNIREYIMEMSHLAFKRKALKLELSDDWFVHLVLISLPAQYGQFKVSYSCQREKWTLNELISYYVQEEERLNQDMIESAHLAITHKDKGTKRNNIEAAKGPTQRKQQRANEGFFFVIKLDMLRMIVPNITLGVSRKGYLNYQKPCDIDRYILEGDGKLVEAEAIKNF